MFTIVVEEALKRGEEAVMLAAPVYRMLSEKIVKELMILGLISFSIFIANQAFHLNETPYFVPL